MSVVDIEDDDDKWLEYVSTLTMRQMGEQFVKCAGEGEQWRCEKLLEQGVDINYAGGAALVEAAGHNRAGIMKMLLEKGIDAQSAMDKALMEAVTGGAKDAVKILLGLKADPKRDDSALLWFAMQGDHAEIADMLLQAGADVHAHKDTLMAMALSHRFEKTAEVFLRHGADVSATFKDMDAFQWAGDMHLPEFSKKLRQWVESDVYTGPEFFRRKTLEELRAVMPGRKGRTGFHVAAAAGSFDVVAEKILSTPGEKMRPEDLLKETPPAGPSVLVVLGQTSQLAIAFDARLWAGRKEEMFEAFSHVPATFRAQVDIDSVASTIDQIALKQGARRYSLKP